MAKVSLSLSFDFSLLPGITHPEGLSEEEYLSQYNPEVITLEGDNFDSILEGMRTHDGARYCTEEHLEQVSKKLTAVNTIFNDHKMINTIAKSIIEDEDLGTLDLNTIELNVMFHEQMDSEGDSMESVEYWHATYVDPETGTEKLSSIYTPPVVKIDTISRMQAIQFTWYEFPEKLNTLTNLLRT